MRYPHSYVVIVIVFLNALFPALMSFLLCQACGGSCLHNMEYKVSLEMHLRFSRLYNCHSLKSCTIINFLPLLFPCIAQCLGFVNRCVVNYRCTIRIYRGFSTQTLINIPSFQKWKLLHFLTLAITPSSL